MKDEHLTTALHKALNRYGTSELPEDAHVEGVTRPARRHSLGDALRRKPGWVTVSEIEASQSPNSYPRLTRRAIKTRCKEMAHEGGTPVEEVRTVGLRSWVRVAASSPSAREDVGGSVERGVTAPVTDVAPVIEPAAGLLSGFVTELVTELVTDVREPSPAHADLGAVGTAAGLDIVDRDIVDRA